MRRVALGPLQRQAYAAIALAAASAIVCGALMVAAMLTPAPGAVVPLAVVICMGCPMAMAWHVPSSISILRASRRLATADEEHALRTLRDHLSRLPEREHPLGF